MPPREPAKDSGKPDLWKEAYVAFKEDPNNKDLINKFYDEICDQSPDGNRIAHLSSDDGRQTLLRLINQKADDIQAMRNPKVDQFCDAILKTRDLVAVATAASPPATIAVAGIFLVFSMRQMYAAESEAMFDTAFEVSKIVARRALEDEQVSSKAGIREGKKLQDLRKSLRESYVDLYKSILCIIVKLFVVLDSRWRRLKTLIGLSDWPAERAKLSKLEGDIEKDLDSIHRFHADGTPHLPGWAFPHRNELHHAVICQLHSKVFEIIQAGKIDINARTRREWTALMLAAEREDVNIVKTLLRAKGIDLNTTNKKGRTALHAASLCNRAEAVKELVSKGAKIDVKDEDGRTAFLDAARLGYLDVLKILVRGKRGQAGADINQTTDNSEWSALHFAVRKKHVDVAKWLLEQGIDNGIRVTGGKDKGLTAREIAERYGTTALFEGTAL
ncbi:uncharacterized protein Z520_04136 [Fonsecaea multimorphosa CBS 102226]|uniref:NWD NACHT-NTPase N-terminal domain-containing protein n=1 Tax=Fonsecaea multimorphosa CBS 102226 TaxID=1442371 RepID=A0A0D2HF01_9EURO|nr:uncharacterized protein Z520_04136 [Fonsecaea multimorphosa CBS 102226]KIY00451.1 hypothetical protein Z520_04136 [Fonsecaea multimorphosa CBS 102226]OAL26965.1 hypothetical protein AYO22_03909 [Fonsecaea multimorphosa]